MVIIHVASFFLPSPGKSNCNPSQPFRPTAPQSILNCSNHNFHYGSAVIILLFTSLTEISSCFLQLSKSKSIRTKSLKPKSQISQIFFFGTVSPSKATLPKPLRNLLTRRCSFSWMESRYSCTLTSNSPGRRKRKTDKQTLMITGRPPCRLALLHPADAPHL